MSVMIRHETEADRDVNWNVNQVAFTSPASLKIPVVTQTTKPQCFETRQAANLPDQI